MNFKLLWSPLALLFTLILCYFLEKCVKYRIIFVTLHRISNDKWHEDK